jgi:capsular polysaccharide biosynthesis protein
VTDQRITFSLNGDSGESERFGAYDDFAATESQPADFPPGLVSLGFIRAAIRRRARFCIVMAVVGLLVGLMAYKAKPHEFQAQASVVITLSPYESFLTATANNEAIAATPAVAGLAVHKLGLHQSPSSFLSTYSATSVTDQLLDITASATSASQAVLRANAVASAFLQFRADQTQGEQNLVLASLQQQVSQAKQHVSSIDAQISQLQGQPGQQSQLSRLQAEQSSALGTLQNVEQAVTGNQTTNQPEVTAAIKNSKILTVLPLAHSRFKPLAIYAVVGLIVGLALSVSIVIIQALVSDRLRRRDDIAYALDAPVRLSVGALGARRRLRGLPGRAAKRDLDMRRVVAHLQSALRRSSTQGPVGLAVVAVDNAPAVAPVVAALATSCASQGHQVVAADLSQGAHMARLLGVKNPGAQAVSRQGVSFTVAVPDPDDAVPAGPLRAATAPAGSNQAGDALAASCASADVLLTLVTLDPALGGDHLATWAPSAVVVVSAGQSSAVRVHAVGEMIRLAGTRLISVVLFGADKTDESLGLTRAVDEQAGVEVLGR